MASGGGYGLFYYSETPIEPITLPETLNGYYTLGFDTIVIGQSNKLVEGELAISNEITFVDTTADGNYILLAADIYTAHFGEGLELTKLGESQTETYAKSEPIFDEKYIGSWQSVSNSYTITIGLCAFAFDDETKQVTKNSDTSFSFDFSSSATWTFEFCGEGENLIIKIQLNANTIYFFEKAGKKVNIPFPEQYRGKTYTRNQFETNSDDITVDEDGFASIGSGYGKRQLRVIYSDSSTAYIYDSSIYVITFGEKGFTYAGLSGYPNNKYQELLSPDVPVVESDDFTAEFVGYWRNLNQTKDYIRIEQNTFFYRYAQDGEWIDYGAYYKATDTTSSSYSVEIGGVTYLVSVSEDGYVLFLYREDNDSVIFFGKGSWDESDQFVSYAYPTIAYSTIFPTFVDSTYTGDNKDGRPHDPIFGAEGQKDIYFDDRSYQPANEDTEYEPFAYWGDSIIEFVTHDESNHSGTLITDRGWFKFQYQGENLDEFVLTITDYKGESAWLFTKKSLIPEIKIPSDYQNEWISENGSISISDKTVMVKFTGMSAEEQVVASVDGSILSFEYDGHTYTLTLFASDLGMYTTDESGARVVYHPQFLSTGVVLNVSNINGTKWQTADGSIKMEIVSFKPSITGKDIRILTKPMSATSSIAGGTYIAYYEGNFYYYAASLTKITFTPILTGLGEELVFTPVVEQGGGDEGATIPEQYRGSWGKEGKIGSLNSLEVGATSLIYMGSNTYDGNVTYNESTGWYTVGTAKIMFVSENVAVCQMPVGAYLFIKQGYVVNKTVPQDIYGTYSDGEHSVTVGATITEEGLTASFQSGTTVILVEENDDGSYTLWMQYTPVGATSFGGITYRWIFKDGTLTIENAEGTETLYTLTLQA